MMTVKQFFQMHLDGDTPGSQEENLPVTIIRYMDGLILCYGTFKEYFDYLKSGALDSLGNPIVSHLSNWSIVSCERVNSFGEYSDKPEYNWPIVLKII